jgi:UDP-N-acetyl-D-glucosamine dehydrogenase
MVVELREREHEPRETGDLEGAFLRKLKDRTFVVGVIGLGYVGLPLAEAFLGRGLKVLGFDVDCSKIEAIDGGKSYIRHIDDTRMTAMRDSGRLDATSDPDRLGEADALLMCIPTPLNGHREPDLSYVEATVRSIAPRLRRGQLVVLESTTYPGTSDEIVRPILEKESGLKSGVDFAVAYSPEREDPGNASFNTSTIPKVVGADSEHELTMACALYGAITEVVPVSDMRTAEAVKLMENIFRLVNIALVNELKTTFRSMDIDIWEVIEAAKTKPFGFMPFYPGPGLGGHCIPIDPFYLTWKSRAHGESTRFIELAGEVVSRLPRQVIETVAEAMSTRLSKALAGSRVLVVGLAYKKNVDDMRESPSLHLISLLQERKAHVDYYDPYLPEVPETRDHPEFAGMKSIALTRETLASYDCVLVSTDHDNVDYDLIAESAPLVVDTRNVTVRLRPELRAKTIKA